MLLLFLLQLLLLQTQMLPITPIHFHVSISGLALTAKSLNVPLHPSSGQMSVTLYTQKVDIMEWV